jgi:hypothetical protein
MVDDEMAMMEAGDAIPAVPIPPDQNVVVADEVIEDNGKEPAMETDIPADPIVTNSNEGDARSAEPGNTHEDTAAEAMETDTIAKEPQEQVEGSSSSFPEQDVTANEEFLMVAVEDTVMTTDS